MILVSAGACARCPLREGCGHSSGDSPSSHAALFCATREPWLDKGLMLQGRGQAVTPSSGIHQPHVGSHKAPRPSLGPHTLC